MLSYSQRFDYAKKHSRCDGENAAIMGNGFQSRQAVCGNCGWAFPPESQQLDGSAVWCSIWGNENQVDRFCRRWGHPDNTAAGVAPEWAVKYTRQRKQ